MLRVARAEGERCKQLRSMSLRGKMRAKTGRKERSQSTGHNCPDCKGTGFEIMKQPTRPGIRIYPARCMKCLGKERLAD